ncbi:MAG: ABC transporter ATP-binding protein [Planctomycetota bacterium]
MISLVDLSKSFGRFEAVRGVSAEIARGEVVGLLGPNGAGKTTTIRMITGTLPPTRGAVRVDGLDSLDGSIEVRRRLGYLPEGSPLHAEMRVEQYLAFRAGLFAVSRKERRAAIARSMDRCELADVARTRCGNLSKGYRQRVGLAAALLHDPDVLILDEPTSGLDPAQVVALRSLIGDLSDTRTTLLVSHILPEVERTCDRIMVFARGRVRADGAPKSLIERHARAGRLHLEAETSPDALRETLGRALPKASAMCEAVGDGWTRATLDAEGPISDAQRASIARTLRDAGVLARELSVERPGLERVYLDLVEGEAS